jgi:asparagine synthase (glutamine-hydrolysing)
MCGIAGIFAYGAAAAPIDKDELLRARDSMAKRGPDAFGAWCSPDQRVGLGHRRLSIIELSERGAQPMQSADGELVVTFNGEIYNYGALRKELEAKGYVFRSHSDTEVLLHLYANKGVDMVHDLRGMFAFGLWDGRRRSLLLARDPYGVKPLYYADDGRTVRFASQVKALIAGGNIAKDPDPAGWVGFYLFGSVPEPHTIYRSISALPAGTTLSVDRSGVEAPRRYFSIARVFAEAEQGELKPDDLEAYCREALLDSVRHHLVSDVPVGAFLSAGVDSGALVGLMRDAGQETVQTITLSFTEFRNDQKDEAPLAEQIARRYGTRHVTRRITEREFQEDLPNILEAMDQPSIDGINTWFVSKAAHEQGLKVAISGLGGDELFGGYPSFRDIPRLVGWTRLPSRLPFAGFAFRQLMTFARRIFPFHPKSAGLLAYGGTYPGAYLLRRGVFLPWELDTVMDKDMAAAGMHSLDPLGQLDASIADGPKSPFGKIASLEASHYMRNQLLRDTDWASMAHSLEVRVPLVDSVLLTKLAPALLAAGRVNGKVLLGRAPKQALPDSILQRGKTGFTVPLAQWLLTSPTMKSWRSIPALRQSTCSWSRRWAYSLAAALAS